MPILEQNLLLPAATKPAGDAALRFRRLVLDLLVRGVNLLQRLAASVLAVLIELVLGVC